MDRTLTRRDFLTFSGMAGLAFTLNQARSEAAARRLSVKETGSPSGRVALVPIDDRPATTQFAQWIAKIADHEIVMPPRTLLGRFTQPGDTARLGEWLRDLDAPEVDALIVSIDMLAFGGLVASREPLISLEEAHRNLKPIREVRRRHPDLPIFAFNIIKRVAPTAHRGTRAYRADLTRYVQLVDQVEKTKDPKARAELEAIRKRLPEAVIKADREARERNLQISLEMIELVREGIVDFLVLAQDDAQIYGLHRQAQARLHERIKQLGLQERVKVYNGADEVSNVLVSRALLSKYRFVPKVFPVYSSDRGRQAIGAFEDHPLEYSVTSQITASGAVVTDSPTEADYFLYVNALEQTEQEFQTFLFHLIADVKAGKYVGVGDVLFKPYSGSSDPRLIEGLCRAGVLDRLIAYAGWNTPSNALGTSIPQANMYVLYRKKLSDRLQRAVACETAHREFLLHRYVDDYGYHAFVRPMAYKFITDILTQETDELDRAGYEQLNRLVESWMKRLVLAFFDQDFRGRTYELGIFEGKRWELEIVALRDLRIHLPWPRAFEVSLEYAMETRVKEKEMGDQGPRENSAFR